MGQTFNELKFNLTKLKSTNDLGRAKKWYVILQSRYESQKTDYLSSLRFDKILSLCILPMGIS